jgi:hypothetical protein
MGLPASSCEAPCWSACCEVWPRATRIATQPMSMYRTPRADEACPGQRPRRRTLRCVPCRTEVLRQGRGQNDEVRAPVLSRCTPELPHCWTMWAPARSAGWAADSILTSGGRWCRTPDSEVLRRLITAGGSACRHSFSARNEAGGGLGDAELELDAAGLDFAQRVFPGAVWPVVARDAVDGSVLSGVKRPEAFVEAGGIER